MKKKKKRKKKVEDIWSPKDFNLPVGKKTGGGG